MSRRHDVIDVGPQNLDVEVYEDRIDAYRGDSLVGRAEVGASGMWWMNVRSIDGGWPPVTRRFTTKEVAALALGAALYDVYA